MSRAERVVGDALRSRTDPSRSTGVAVGARVPNQMLELGRPESVRLA